MAWRNGHGRGSGVPRIEVLPADEQAPPDPAKPARPPVRRHANGKLADKASAAELGRLGGLAKAERTRLLSSLGLVSLSVNDAFYAYENAGEAFAEKHMQTLADMFDGKCGEGPMSIVKTAGIQLAASRFFYDLGKQTGDAKMLGEASRLGDASRQNILAAYELQSREAAARRASKSDDHDSLASVLGKS
jgi:hypothetical protein